MHLTFCIVYSLHYRGLFLVSRPVVPYWLWHGRLQCLLPPGGHTVDGVGRGKVRSPVVCQQTGQIWVGQPASLQLWCPVSSTVLPFPAAILCQCPPPVPQGLGRLLLKRCPLALSSGSLPVSLLVVIGLEEPVCLLPKAVVVSLLLFPMLSLRVGVGEVPEVSLRVVAVRLAAVAVRLVIVVCPIQVSGVVLPVLEQV
jgi:hypothetical protein